LFAFAIVATVLTACGIETGLCYDFLSRSFLVATVLTACGIETPKRNSINIFRISYLVATVLTACGIETHVHQSRLMVRIDGCNSTYRLRY